ncbi:nucleotide exchange factor GrpE [Marinimicrobium sp. C2-29]|uniref:nucleotide exchange factor GrpE n=1 Tax=Marinimicrobium sp. C2-29 TaxID=3139825 RepID=UPI003138D2ED
MANEDKRDSQEQTEQAEQQAEAQTAEQVEAETANGNAQEGEQPRDGEDTVESLRARLDSLNAAMEAAKEQVLRSQAEAQNARRRADQDIEKAHKFGQEKLVVDLLPVVDNLERALDSLNLDDPSFKAIIEGIELTHKSFIDVLAKHKIEAINPEGEPFDPELHQAMTMVANPDVEPNTVIDVFQKGYTLHGRLVRPAMVVVSKPE